MVLSGTVTIGGVELSSGDYLFTIPGEEHDVVAVSDAHSLIEIGVAYSALDGDPMTPGELLAALADGELVPGRATYFARLLTPVSKVVQRVRGNGRVQPAGLPARPPEPPG